MHFLITGHTGFKGTWLTLLLHQRGHQVSGISLAPQPDSLFVRAEVSKYLANDIRCDIRNAALIKENFKSINPDVVIHLAAQSLVRESYKDPITTFETNLMGTVNVLKASQSVEKLRAQLIVTTDKVYQNSGKSEGYIESDPLGGLDPYSASKAMADIATQSWLASYLNAPTAIARAGNVIGGGDFSADRLVPDLIRSFSIHQIPKLRAPNSVRPWQHVLDCLNGYLILVEKMLGNEISGAWNFGPNETQFRTVANVTEYAGEIWNAQAKWVLDENIHPNEATLLTLNSNKARLQLGWLEKLEFEQSIRWSIEWYKRVYEGESALENCLRNIKDFELMH
jgi:CDP-glucose 4,6-dehydratase